MREGSWARFVVTYLDLENEARFDAGGFTKLLDDSDEVMGISSG